MDGHLMDAALDYAARHWAVVPILPGQKRPAIERWTERATTDPDLIAAWWRAHPDHGIGIATGPASDIFVLDVDNSGDKLGDDTLRRLEATHGELPHTYTVQTGSGGWHYYFRWPGWEIRNDAGKRLGPGLDIRGAGGQVVAPPTIHPNGQPYRWSHGDDPVDAPDWLLGLLRAPDAPEPDRTPTTTVDVVSDRPGDRFTASTTWPQLLEADGWTLHHVDRNGEEHWTRPGKDRREGTSATVGYQGLDVLHVFSSSVAGLDPEGTYNRFGYYAAVHFGGDHTAAARELARVHDADELARWLADVSERLAPQPAATAMAAPSGSRFQPGGTWLLDVPDQVPSRWGEDDAILWAQGEPLILAGPPGVGKTTISSQLIMGMCGVRSTDVLGLPVQAAERVLILACDRPDQLRRAFRRLVLPDMRDQLDDRLVVWPGPPPADLARNPRLLYEMTQDAGADVCFIDSLKDVALGLTDDEVGAGINSAMQLCVANGVDVAASHHQRKRQQGAGKPKTLDDLYGSAWIAAGAGSVILLYGEAGDPVVDFIHLKQPVDVVGPWRIAHDAARGISEIVDGSSSIDPAFLLGNHPHGLTAHEVARVDNRGRDPQANEVKRMKRKLDRLVELGQVVVDVGGRSPETGRQVPDTYRLVR